MNPADIALLESLIEIAMKASAAIKSIKDDKPEVYAAIGQHHKEALAKLEAAAG